MPSQGFEFLRDVDQIRFVRPAGAQKLGVADGPLVEVLFVEFRGAHESIIGGFLV
jgi:hypothetical protein